MADFFKKFIKSLEKLFAPLPHLPTKSLKIFLPIIPWYLFLRGLIKIISGLRSLSASFQLGALPKIFNKVIELNPIFLFWDGIILLTIGFLYFNSFINLSQKKTQFLGWKNWLLATLLTTGVRLYRVIFNNESAIIMILITLIGWFFIFEFKKLYQLPETKKKK